ncbi:unnamed protein product [Phaedon cochleariae]|uniref:Glucose-methanol-choline oxidoreductase N-terminal domain-containing protein n=1 Tax=Phaedon cochleariae TaxID=80249 RepID=A0A9P0GVK3_PHACE|nr:unnamed protein product [Phaedon cochleariae]
MFARTLLFVLLAIFSRALCTPEEVHYYEKLINSEVTKALQYELPKDAKEYQPQDKVPRDFGSFDFVIVGAGSTGSVIASRLSEIGKWKILLLEAGQYPNNFTMIPRYFAISAFSEYNWGFKSTPQKTACLGAVENRCLVHRGKGVGGTSLINELVYSRGNINDYNRLSKLLADPSWDYEHVLPYFKKSENFHKNNPNAPADLEFHGTNGYLNTNYHLPPSNYTDIFLKANRELGINITDYNGLNEEGATILQINTKHGKRLDEASAFIAPVMGRSNLVISVESYVNKIEFDKHTKEAIAVIFTKHNRTYRVKAKKEIIMSTGTISTPPLLMLSGIGPKKHLDSIGIPVISDLEVGSSLREHVFCGVQFSSNTSYPSQSLQEQIKQYLSGYGDLTASNPIDGAGWYRTAIERKGSPDIEMVMSSSTPSELGKKFLGWDDETWSALFNITIPNPFTLTPVLLHSQSTGRVRLQYNDPYQFPVIDYNLLSDSNNLDIDSLYEGIQMALNLTETEAFQRIGAKLEVRQLPACTDYEFLTKNYWYCYIRQTAMAAYHPVGTCPMGPDPMKGAVVDSNLNVYGVGRLRVADASILPFTFSGHPNAVCVMIGEKISEVIKYEYGISN